MDQESCAVIKVAKQSRLVNTGNEISTAHLATLKSLSFDTQFTVYIQLRVCNILNCTQLSYI